MANRRLEPWEIDLVRNVDDKAVRDLVADLRNYNPSPSMGKAAKVKLEGVGVVQTGDDGVKHRPMNPSQNGWTEAKPIRDWRPPGEAVVNAMLDAEDKAWREDRQRQARLRREAEEQEIRELEAKLNPEPKGPEK
jgi:hypothetical protein